jgi:hypothetical protein
VSVTEEQAALEATQSVEDWIESLQQFDETLEERIAAFCELVDHAAEESDTAGGSEGDESQDSDEGETSVSDIDAAALFVQLDSLQEQVGSLAGRVTRFRAHFDEQIEVLPDHFQQQASAKIMTAGTSLTALHPDVPDALADVSAAVLGWNAATNARFASAQNALGRVDESLAALAAKIGSLLSRHSAYVSEEVMSSVSETLRIGIQEIAENLGSMLREAVSSFDGLQTLLFDAVGNRCELAFDTAEAQLTGVQSNLCARIQSRLRDEIQERIERLIADALAGLITEVQGAVTDTTLSEQITAMVSPYMPQLIALYHLADAIEAAVEAKNAAGL